MNLTNNFTKSYLKKMKNLSFNVQFENGEELTIGNEKPKFKLDIKKPLDKKKIFKSATLALGEAYMDEDIEIDGDLREVLDEVMGSDAIRKNTNVGLRKILRTSTNASNQKKEVCSHYNLGNEFYGLWLDETLSYSCGYFKSENDSLYEAQLNKIHYILKKLNLKEGMTLLDIGCGFGGLLIEAAKIYKVKGVGITLSEEQFNKFKERIKEENLDEYIEIKLMDYRGLKRMKRKFDRVVSVGMLEHVGRKNYDLFFKCIDNVLSDDGVFLLHYISGRKESDGDPWIKKYIFPGGVIPSLREIISLSGDYDYYVRDVESLRMHYALTLDKWYENFNMHLDEISKLFGKRFIRMWNLYLASCRAAFRNGIVDIHQIVFSKGVDNTLPLTREELYK